MNKLIFASVTKVKEEVLWRKVKGQQRQGHWEKEPQRGQGSLVNTVKAEGRLKGGETEGLHATWSFSSVNLLSQHLLSGTQTTRLRLKFTLQALACSPPSGFAHLMSMTEDLADGRLWPSEAASTQKCPLGFGTSYLPNMATANNSFEK